MRPGSGVRLWFPHPTSKKGNRMPKVKSSRLIDLRQRPVIDFLLKVLFHEGDALSSTYHIELLLCGRRAEPKD